MRNLKLMLALLAVGGTGGAANAAEVVCVDGRAGSYPCRGVNLVAHMPSGAIGGGRLSDIWGWTGDGGREIAIVGRYSGTSFVDITDPENPVFLGSLHAHDGHDHGASAAAPTDENRRTPQHESESNWRDIKVYQNYALIVGEESGHGMQVFDLTRLPPADASDLPREFSETAHYDRFGNAHNIAVNPDSGYAYAVGSTAGAFPYGGGLHIVDLSDPLNPQRAGGFSADGYTHDVQCVNYEGPDQAFAGREVCLAANEDTLTVVDVTVKSGPSLVSRTGYPAAAYAHQGWLSDDQRYFFVNDESDEQITGRRTRTLIWDVSRLSDPQLVSEYRAPSTAADHNNYVNGGHLFQSNYTSGLRVLDIGRPAEPLEVGFFDTQPGNEAPIHQGSWSNYPFFPSGVVALTDIHDGLFLLRPTVVSATEAVDLTVDISGPSEADSGEDMAFDLSVVNNGPDAAPAVELVFSLPRTGTITQSPAECEVRAVTAVCRLGDLAAGESTQVSLTASATRATVNAIAFAAAQADEQNTADNRRIHSVDIQNVPAPSFGGGGGGGAMSLGILLLGGLTGRRRRLL